MKITYCDDPVFHAERNVIIVVLTLVGDGEYTFDCGNGTSSPQRFIGVVFKYLRADVER